MAGRLRAASAALQRRACSSREKFCHAAVAQDRSAARAGTRTPPTMSEFVNSANGCVHKHYPKTELVSRYYLSLLLGRWPWFCPFCTMRSTTPGHCRETYNFERRCSAVQHFNPWAASTGCKSKSGLPLGKWHGRIPSRSTSGSTGEMTKVPIQARK